MNVLYLISKAHKPSAQIFSTPKPEKVFLCAVEYGCENTLKELTDILTCRSTPFEIVNFQAIFNANALRYKQDFLKFINDLGNRKPDGQVTWKELYQLPGEDFSAWWLSLVYEKNPYKSDVYTQWTKIRTIIELRKTMNIDQIWIDPQLDDIQIALQSSSIKDQVIALAPSEGKAQFKRSLFYIFMIEKVRTLKLLAELFYKIILLKIFYLPFWGRVARLKKSRFLLLTMFPLLDEKALSDGKFVNRAYGPLQTALSGKTDGAVTWLGMFSGTGFKDTPGLLNTGRKVIQSGENFFFYEEFLGLRGLAKILWNYIRFSFKTFSRIKDIQRQFTCEVDDITFDGWDLWKKDVISSFAGKELCLNLSFYFSFSPVLSRLPEGATVLYFSEMHGWDHALNANVRKYPHLTSVGLQHTIVPILLMNYFHDPKESRLPLPHLLACTGEMTSKIFLEHGWDPKKIFILGGFRFQSIGVKLKKEPAELLKKNQIVAALSISDRENSEILCMLHDAFNDTDLNVRILIKPHPLNDIHAAIENLGLQFNPKIFEITMRPLGEIVPGSLAMIVKESSSSFEALAVNVPVIVPSLYSIIDLCPLFKLSDLPVYVNGAEELVDAVRNLVQGRGVKTDARKGREFLKKYAHILDKEEDYWHNLEKALAGHRGNHR